jgi:hypothetical protein
MVSAALTNLKIVAFRPTRRDVWRGVAAGMVWGLTLTAGLAAMTAWQCGGLCLPEVAVNSVLSVAGGILGIGPIAAYGRRGQ